jgi:hypothetical protein
MPNLTLATLKVFCRILAGAVAGIVVVSVYVGIDYMGQADKRLYFVD